MRLRPTFFAVLAAALALSVAPLPVLAQGKAPDPPKPSQAAKDQPAQDQKKEEPKKEEPKKEEPKKDPKVEEYEKAIKDLTRIEGAFTFYQRKKDVLLELSESSIGKLFFVQATLNTGISAMGGQAGEPLGAFAVDAFRWDRTEDRVVLTRPNLRYRWKPDDPLAVASKRSFPEAHLADFRIEQSHPEKKLLLVNVTSLFFGDLFRIGEMLQLAMGGPYALDREKSSIERLKSYEENTVVRVAMHYQSPKGPGASNPLLELLGLGSSHHLEDGRSAPFKVTYNLWYRKESDYQARLSDPRVGYFTEDYFSVGRFLEDDRTERMIIRFGLKKKDPGAKLSDPVKPIVWYLDHSIPKEYREAVREGVLRWNPAFERLGYKNAIQVKEVADDDADWDHADGRFNVIRWTMSEDAGYAVAQPRIDPFTGEVLNASVTFDANMLSFAQQEYRLSTLPASQATAKALKALTDLDSPVDPIKELWGEIDPAAEAFKKLAARFGWRAHSCAYAHGLREQAAFALRSAEALGLKVSKEDYARQFISDTISHEVGHCLGLRHNFVASTNLTTAQLADDSLLKDQGVTASVMDYTPTNIVAVLKGGGFFFMPTIGAYDKWAIEYGYCDARGRTPQQDYEGIKSIAAQSGAPGHAYMTDEDADSFNPYAVRFDQAKDPLNYSAKVLEAARRTRAYAVRSLPKPGDSYALRNQLILTSTLRTFREGRYAARFVGGIVANRNHRGDLGERNTLEPVPAQTQREAMRLIARECLSQTAIDVPAKVLLNMAMDFNKSEGSTFTAPLRSLISSSQTALLSTLMSARTVTNIVENQYKLGGASNVYTLTEHYGVILGTVFSEVGPDSAIAPTRRDLQKFCVTALITQASAPLGSLNGDVRTVAADAVRRLDQRFADALAKSKNLDGLTRIHLQDLREAIQRYRSRQISVTQ